MNEAAVRNSLDELKEILAGSTPPASPGEVHAPAEGLYVSCQASRTALQDSLDHLRVMVKYLVFDIEATRRENRYLRQMLESRLRQDREDEREGLK